MGRILIVEKNETISSYLTSVLKRAGHSIVTVDNALAAWKEVWQGAFDALFISISLPEIDGFSLAQKALLETPDAQVVFLTGFTGVAMDTHGTPPYAPAPLTLDSFHLRDAADYVRYLLGYGHAPVTAVPAATARTTSNVIYADFAQKRVFSHCSSL